MTNKMTVFSNVSKLQILRDFTLCVFWSVFNVVYLTILSKLINNFAESNPILTIIISYFSFLLIWEVIEYVSDVYQSVSCTKIEAAVKSKVLENTYKLKPEVIKKYNTGYINGVTSKYIENKIDTYNQFILFAPLSIIYMIYCIIMVSTHNIIYGLILLCLSIIATIIKYKVNNKKEREKLAELDAIRDKIVIDSISNINTIQKMQSIDFIQNILADSNKKCIKQAKRWALKHEVGFTLYKFLIFIYMPIVCLVFYFFPNTIGDKMAFFSFLSVVCVQIVHTAKNIANALIAYAKYSGSKAKLKEIYKDKNIRRDILQLNEFRFAEINDVSYEYNNEETNKKITIQIPEFKVNKGDKICLYGESGQGKSTLLNILSGEIETTGVKINNLPLIDKRLECVFISQDTEILDMSLRDNLTLGNKDIKDEEIINLLFKCGLGGWFSKQSAGLDTILGERGVFVSTGQRQRLNIIRGLLIKDKEIYLLDEPTSNVDEITEERIIDIIKEYLQNKTMIVVTHRPKIKEICNKAYKFTNSILGKEEIL